MIDDARDHRHGMALDDSPAVQRVIAALHDLYAPEHPPCAHRLDDALLLALRERRAASACANGGILTRPSVVSRVLLLSLAALMMLAGVVVVRIAGPSPTPVSAQVILSRAAAAGVEPGGATHVVYRLSTSDGLAGTADAWIATSSTHGVTRLALRLNGAKSTPAASFPNMRLVELGSSIQTYNPATNTLTGGASEPGTRAWLALVDGALISRKLESRQFSLTAGAPVASIGPRITRQTLDGISVYALRANRELVLYFDAHTYLLRGADWVLQGRIWHERLVRYQQLSIAEVPAGTFTLVVPASANVARPTSRRETESSSRFAPRASHPVAVSADFPLPFVAAAVGLSPANLHRALNRGETLFQLGERRYRSSSTMSASLLAGLRKKFQDEVSQGRMTASQEHREYSALLLAVSRLMETHHPALVWLPRWNAYGFSVRASVRSR